MDVESPEEFQPSAADESEGFVSFEEGGKRGLCSGLFRPWSTDQECRWMKLNLDVVKSELDSGTVLISPGYSYDQSVMRTAAIVLDIEECFHSGVRELLVIRAQGVS